MARQIKCTCQNNVIPQDAPRTTQDQALAPRNQGVLGLIRKITAAINSVFEGILRQVPALSVVKNCKVCKGKGTIDDPTDTTDADQKTKEWLEQNTEKITKAEARLGLGGNRTVKIAGNDVLLIGHDHNIKPGHVVREKKGFAPAGSKVTAEGRAPHSIPTSTVVGVNIPGTPGGSYFIKCTNGFYLKAGTRGIDFETAGPITFKGGQLRFIGCDMTFGGKQGQTTIEGEHLVLKGQTVSIEASHPDADIHVQGSMSVASNLKAGGLYCDNFFASKAYMPEKQVASKISSPGNVVNGPEHHPATAGGRLNELTATQAKNTVQDHTLDPTLASAASVVTPRGALKVVDDLKNILFGIFPLNQSTTGLQETGKCQPLGIIGYGLGIVFASGSFHSVYSKPHVHGENDGPHSHTVAGLPNIETESHPDASAVRARWESVGGNTKSAVATVAGDPLGILLKVTGLFNSIGATFKTLTKPFHKTKVG
jgi:hypothetical protein